MTEYNVYVDKVFAGNFLVSFTILWAAARLSQAKMSYARLLAGAVMGSLYSVAVFIPELSFIFGLPSKILVSFLIVLITFAPHNVREFINYLVTFYLVSFALGGMVFGFAYFFGSVPDPTSGVKNMLESVNSLFLPGMAFSLLALWGAVRAAFHIREKYYVRARLSMKLLIRVENLAVDVEALLDTGNCLVDPLTKHPVIVAEYQSIKKLLPMDFRHLYEKGEDLDFTLLLGALEDNAWKTRFRLIPFQSLGQENGMLLAFRPDEIEIRREGGGVLKAREVVVGIYRRRLNAGASYRALLSPELFGSAA